jgi:hypothetical protein
MHGGSYRGDGGAALGALAVAYESEFPVTPNGYRLGSHCASDRARVRLVDSKIKIYRRTLGQRVGFQNPPTACDQQFQAAGSYSLMRPPRTGRRRIRS